MWFDTTQSGGNCVSSQDAALLWHRSNGVASSKALLLFLSAYVLAVCSGFSKDVSVPKLLFGAVLFLSVKEITSFGI